MPITTDPELLMEQSVSSGGAQPSAKAIYLQRKNYAKNVASMGEMSDYKVEHLVTFALERKEAILTVDDSIRKLQLLEARGKVWTQEIIMRVDDKSVKLIDIETKEELENFPLLSLQHIQSVIDACSYNSICALLVKDTDQKTPDIHLFQCSSVPADVICADINSACQDIKSKKGRKSRPDTLRRHRETIEANTRPPTLPPINVKDRVAEWTNAIEAQNEAPPLSGRSSLNGQAENSPEVVAFKIHRDVQMLNHALDDIELFVSMLRKSAEATKELTFRQSKKKSSKKGKGKVPGSGIMSLRARLPPQEHFVETFQKIRFCFNLLAKLKAHIKDPNATELSHFLFHPLGIIINTCCGPELARTVQTPLLTKDAIEFLRSCATSQEMQLWFDLGPYWTQTKNEFPKEMFFPPYVPTFTSGWVPPPILSMDAEPHMLAAAIQDQAHHVQRVEEAWKAGGANIEDALKPLSPATTAEAFPPRKPSIITPQRKPSVANGHRAPNVFKNHVESHIARNQAAQSIPPPPVQPASPRKLCRAMYDFAARNEHELSVHLDDLLDVLDDSKTWWRVQDKHGETGYVPANLMLLISSATKAPPPPSYMESPPNFVPPPPPPPPPVAASAPPPAPPVLFSSVPVSPPIVKTQPISSASLSSVVLKKTAPQPAKRTPHVDSDVLQAELRHRVSSQKQRNFVLPKKSSSSNQLILNKSSTQPEVAIWLRSHGFSDLTIASLSVLNGAQIFTLTKEELKQISDDEGSRVHSLLMVQRSMDGFATASAGSELNKIMKKRREIIPDPDY